MDDTIKQQEEAIIAILREHPGGLSRRQVAEYTQLLVGDKTLQRRLVSMAERGVIIREGQRKATRYFPAKNAFGSFKGHLKDSDHDIFSTKSQKALGFLQNPPHAREEVSYKHDFLDSYVPNKSHYLPSKLQETLFLEGKRFDSQLAAGTYAQQICQRLLIDLSYNSSRLEGNTYSRLDTQKLIEENISAEGKVHEETVMIMNHKEAILFLVENAAEIELNTLTIRNLHHLLSQDLLANAEAGGNVRTIAVDIGQSTYKPLANPHVLREKLELVVQKAKNIADPFEQSFFLLVHLSYLQAFEDVNKRTSRLSCNIPFIKNNLCPLSFTDVSRDDYIAALLAIYEKQEVEPMLELFTWAYLRSCKHYGVVKKSLGEIDTFRVQYRQKRKEVMGQIVRKGLHGNEAEQHILNYCREQGIDDSDKFIAITLADLSTLHVGAIIGLRVTEREFKAWYAQKP